MTEKQLSELFKNVEVWYRGQIDHYYFTFQLTPKTSSRQRFEGRMNLHVPERNEYDCMIRWGMTPKQVEKLFQRERKNMIMLIKFLLFEAANIDERAAAEYIEFKKRYEKDDPESNI